MSDIILYDIGAHTGAFTRNFLKTHKNVISYMFEANPKLFKPKDLSEHYWFNTVLSNLNDNEVSFYYRNGTGDSYYKEIDLTQAYTDPEKYSILKLKTKRLDSFDIPLPDVIKIDTQGSELDILRGCDDILKNCQTIYCEIPAPKKTYNQGAPSYKDYIDFFTQAGFKNQILEKEKFARGELVQYDMIFKKE